MSYHNVRDKYGKFAPKGRSGKKKKEAKTIFNIFLLDRSISMAPKKNSTIEGYNSVLEGNKEDTKTIGVKSVEALALFSTPEDYTYKEGKVEPLTHYSYNPHGQSTALYDAIARTISFIEKDLKRHPALTRVVFTIFTDGEENSSKEYSSWQFTNGKSGTDRLKDLIEEKQQKGWVINFMGAGDKWSVDRAAGNIGIFTSNTMNYANTSQGVSGAAATLRMSNTAYKSAVASGNDSNAGFFSNK